MCATGQTLSRFVSRAVRCIGPTAKGSGELGTEAVTWVADSSLTKTRVLARIGASFHRFCARRDRAKPLRYIEGRDWLAMVGFKVDMRAAASALGGRAIAKECG